MSGNLWLLIPVLLPIVMGIIMSLFRVKSIKVTQSLVVGTVLVNFAALIYALNFGSQLTVDLCNIGVRYLGVGGYLCD